MKLPFGAENGKKDAHRASAVLWLFGLLVCYQAGYQVYMSFVLGQDPSALDPWCNGSQGSAQQCVEAQLFRGWQSEGDDLLLQKESQDKVNDLLQVRGSPQKPSTMEAPPRAVTSKPSAPKDTEKPPAKQAADEAAAAAESNTEQETKAMTPWSRNLIALQKNFEERMQHRHEHHQHVVHSTIQEWHNMSSLSRDLQALHERFGKRLAERRAHTEEAKDEFKNLTKWAKDVQVLQQHFENQYSTQDTEPQAKSSSSQEDNMTPLSRDLVALQGRMQARMEAHNKAHRHLDELDARVAAHKKVLHELDGESHGSTLLEQIAALGKEMCSDAKHRQDPKCAQFVAGAPAVSASTTPRGHLRHSHKQSSLNEAEAELNKELHHIAEKQEAWEKSFVAKVSDTMEEFCADPIHRTQKTCKEFLRDHPHSSEALDVKAKNDAWHQTFRKKITNVGHELCSNPMRRDYLICKQILGDEESSSKSSGNIAQTSTTGVTQQDSRNDDKAGNAYNARSHERLELHWSTVAQWEKKSSKGLRGSTAATAIVTVKEADASKLRVSAHWSGRVPTAACITLVPKGDAGKTWMKYFIDNFRLQNYEGSHQLVLVYHYSDKQVAELVHKYVDGTYIKAAEARGEEYPSAAAFRFGAWLARDADVVARWEFGAWHHPQRLSMQVRSLAFSGRPAGVLKQWTVLEKQGTNTTERTEEDGERWDSSLVGEAAWMRKNWYPYMSQERAVFEAHAPSDVVKLETPGLEVFDEAARW